MKNSSMQPMMKSEPKVMAARSETELPSCVCFSFPVNKVVTVVLIPILSRYVQME